MFHTLKQVPHSIAFPVSNTVESGAAKEDQDISITYDKSVTLVRINCPRRDGHDWVIEAFTALEKCGMAFDMVSIQPCEVSFTVKSWLVDSVYRSLEKLEVYPDSVTDCVKLSVRGRSGQPLLSSMITMAETLAQCNIPLLRLVESYGLIEVLIATGYISEVRKALAKNFNC
jgi:aspartate kinase